MSQNQYLNQSIKKYWTRVWLWMRIWCHVVSGLLTLSLQFPFMGQDAKDRHIKMWSLRLLSIFRIKLKTVGGQHLPSSPFLLAANHISWMDIHAINAYRPIRFVAKSDVESWPVFGWMAKQLGTVFIKRDSARHGRHVVNEVSKVLAREPVCIFPEGTSTLGEDVLPFRPNLFESAVIAGVPVYSLAISYKSADSGVRSNAPAFVGEMGLLESMSNILQSPGLIVELTFLPPSEGSLKDPIDRKQLALHSQVAISALLQGDQGFM